MSDRETAGAKADKQEAPRFGGRAWPWIVLGVIAALLVALIADRFGWSTWVRGLLSGVCGCGRSFRGPSVEVAQLLDHLIDARMRHPARRHAHAAIRDCY